MNERAPSGDRRTVQVPRTLLVTGAAVVAICLVTIGFLLGRESGRRSEARHAAPVVTGTPFDAARDPVSAWTGPSTASSAVPDTAPGAPPPAYPVLLAGGGERETVASYFAQVEAIEARAKTWSDPTALAQNLLSQVVNGDPSGFDGLIAAQRAARRDLQALVPPEACRAHLERTLALLDEATALLEGVRDRILGGDIEGLAGFALQAQGLEARAREVDTLAAGIKTRYGL